MIKLFRELKGISQKDLALELGISPSKLCKIERNLLKPLFELVEHVAAYLDQPLQDFQDTGKHRRKVSVWVEPLMPPADQAQPAA